MNGQEKQITLELKLHDGTFQNPVKNGVELLKKYFPNNITDRLKGIKGRHDLTGIVFDIEEDSAERFIEIAAHLKETDSRIDFDV